MTKLGFASALARMVAGVIDLAEQAYEDGILDEMAAAELAAAAEKLRKFGPPKKDPPDAP